LLSIPLATHLCAHLAPSSLTLSLPLSSPKQGPADSLEFRIFQNTKGAVVSAWHDIPLYAGDGLLHFVCEIPKETSAKMELATDETSNPIKQDIKKGKLRFYPYNIHWNYGMLPQTWEDPDHKNPDCFNAGVSRIE
jgi:inorganic pyrophosphatase